MQLAKMSLNDTIEAIKKAAKAILDGREQHTKINLANMYKEKNFILFGDLKTAHDNLNRAAMKAYGFSVKEMTESMCVAELMKMYQKLVDSES